MLFYLFFQKNTYIFAAHMESEKEFKKLIYRTFDIILLISFFTVIIVIILK